MSQRERHYTMEWHHIEKDITQWETHHAGMALHWERYHTMEKTSHWNGITMEWYIANGITPRKYHRINAVTLFEHRTITLFDHCNKLGSSMTV